MARRPPATSSRQEVGPGEQDDRQPESPAISTYLPFRVSASPALLNDVSRVPQPSAAGSTPQYAPSAEPALQAWAQRRDQFGAPYRTCWSQPDNGFPSPA